MLPREPVAFRFFNKCYMIDHSTDEPNITVTIQVRQIRVNPEVEVVETGAAA